MVDSSAGPSRQQMVDVWSEVLGAAGPSDVDEFFTSGGNSLKAMRVCARLSSISGRKIPVRTLLEHSKFGEFVEAVRSM